MHKDAQGNTYQTYQELTDAMLDLCKHPDARGIAAGFGDQKVKELLEHCDDFYDDKVGAYNLAAAAADFDAFAAVEERME